MKMSAVVLVVEEMLGLWRMKCMAPVARQRGGAMKEAVSTLGRTSSLVSRYCVGSKCCKKIALSLQLERSLAL